MVSNSTSYPSTVYDPNNTICNLKNNSFCSPNCDYHGETSDFFVNSYSISIIYIINFFNFLNIITI
jgi:hypothetical protein